jgi:hypothetical protein
MSLQVQGKSMKSLRRNLPVAAVLGMAIAAVLLAGCGRQDDNTADAQPAAADTAGALPAPVAEAPADAPVALADVIETSPQAVVGISYAAGLDQYQGLAKALQDYAAAARGELQQAIDGLGNDKPTMPYELSLAFEKQLETPELVVVRAEGSRYTGGAHGEPLVARFVWLPGPQQMLTADHLVPDAKGWKAISDFVADQLRERVATRLSSEDMEPGELQESLRSASRMINEGTGARPDNFRQFEPMTDAAGKVTGLRFVFPPYQVGPYSEGTQTAEVPASVLAPHVAPEYAGLFAHG